MRKIPQQRIVEKVDEYMSRRDYAGVERHLLYWLAEAEQEQDLAGELVVHNELVGHYRKMADKEKALLHAKEALHLLDVLEMRGTISEGTTCINAATACHAFGELATAMPLFERARRVYEENEHTDPKLMGGLYNNMALVCAALGRYSQAYELYDRAMDEMSRVPGGALEQAITCLNRAGALEAELGMEAAEQQIYGLLDQAEALLDSPDIPRDGYYAFVCEKCAPGFSHYGYFLTEQTCRRRAEEIYGGVE